MKLVKVISRSIHIVVCLAVISAAERASAIVLASDNAADSAYAFQPDGAWKGIYNPGDPHAPNQTPPAVDSAQNPPGNDNGGAGFGIWNFSRGAQRAGGAYGNLNHFIDGVDFPTTAFNNLSAPAFGLGNCNDGTGLPCGGATAVAQRPFAQPLAVGDVFSADIDTPAELDRFSGLPSHYPFAIISFRDSDGITTFGMEAGDIYPWRFGDRNHFAADFGEAAGVGSIDPLAPSDGSSIRLEILSPTTGRVTFDGVSLDIDFIAGLPTSAVFTLFQNNAEADAMGNPTGEHAFYFNNLKIERPPFGVPGDFNDDDHVDAADYVVWRKNNGTNNTLPNDNDLGTPIGPAHYNLWRQNFGNTTGAGSVAGLPHSVPEAATTLLAAAALFACSSWRSAKTWRYERHVSRRLL
ncbi:MAG TPA: hypothetical protein VHK01_13465 [Lacipirellulaceae bacterium]|jgi:hypothetical protein|nr:hypothetical protein [Lacipirellulaceae bacterium]